jgi:hypothetical protein
MTIEFFAVAPQEDEEFVAAWAAGAPDGATLHRALRRGVQPRFAALPSGAPNGALLIVTFEDERGLAGWEPVRELLSGRQGYLGARLLRDPGGRPVAVVHWSSPLMYARAVREEGEVIPARAALYGTFALGA